MLDTKRTQTQNEREHKRTRPQTNERHKWRKIRYAPRINPRWFPNRADDWLTLLYLAVSCCCCCRRLLQKFSNVLSFVDVVVFLTFVLASHRVCIKSLRAPTSLGGFNNSHSYLYTLIALVFYFHCVLRDNSQNVESYSLCRSLWQFVFTLFVFQYSYVL